MLTSSLWMTPICNLGIVGACCVLLLPLLLPETMSYVKKILLRSISVLMGLCAALVVVIVVGVLVSRRFRSTPAFRDPSGSVVTGSIATLEDMKLGDYQQTLLIRGRNSKNPILLYLHGGPGMTELPLVRHFNAALEERFTVVLWEQRDLWGRPSRKKLQSPRFPLPDSARIAVQYHGFPPRT